MSIRKRLAIAGVLAVLPASAFMALPAAASADGGGDGGCGILSCNTVLSDNSVTIDCNSLAAVLAISIVDCSTQAPPQDP